MNHLSAIINNKPGINEQLGESIGSGLQSLTEMHLQDVAQKKAIKQGAQLWKSMGATDQQAMAFAAAPKEIQKSLLDRLEGQSIGVQQGPSGLNALQGMQQQTPTEQQQVPGQTAIPGSTQQQNGLRIGANPEEKRHRETLQQKELDRADRNKQAQFRNTEEFRKEMRVEYEKNKKDLQSLQEMQKLNEEGKLDHPATVKLLKKAGLDWMLSPESQEYESLSTDFIRNAKEYFGGRITNTEFEEFLKTLPDLHKSKEARERITNRLIKIAQAGRARWEAYKEVLKENNNVPPNDLDIQVEDKIDQKLNKLSDEFKNGWAMSEYQGANVIEDENGNQFGWDKEQKRYRPLVKQQSSQV